jgi:hypothetical protein
MADNSTDRWQLVSAEQPSYRNLTAEEVTLTGTMMVENYGKPGVSYVRAPHNYWLVTDDKKRVALSINDSLFPPLDGKKVKVKGKWQAAGLNEKQLFVGWIKTLE